MEGWTEGGDSAGAECVPGSVHSRSRKVNEMGVEDTESRAILERVHPIRVSSLSQEHEADTETFCRGG